MESQDTKQSRDAEICSVCNTVIRPSSIFCEKCGPPQLPSEEVPESLGFGQTFFRILLVAGVFGGLVFYKAQPETFASVDTLVTKIKSELPLVTEKFPAADEPDFKLVHKVNVDRANVRAKPSSKSDVIEVLPRGSVVSVISKAESWSQIQLEKKKGWIASHLLDSRVE